MSMATLVALLQSFVLMSPPATAVDIPAGRLVSDVAAPNTPHVLDGKVFSVVQVGNMMVLGGTFTTARNDSSQTQLSRSRLLAFNATTGQISTSFVPNPNGTVNVVLPAGDGTSVYVGGSFTSIGGQARKNLARVRVSDGAVLTGFNAGNLTGAVNDLRLVSGRLWVGGLFTHVNGTAQRALATLNPNTGAFDPYMRATLAGVHNGGGTEVNKMDVTPDGTRLVAIGNFDTLDGAKKHQLLMLDLTGPSAAPADFQTSFYEPSCATVFYSNMHDVDFSPDGSFFVVGTTGAYGGSDGPCDTTARFETGSTGTGIQPSWVDYTGGDTTWGVEVTDSAVYVGGHQRWQNNPFAGDSPGPGAVSRPGIAALDPINGLPFSWNPTRTRGVGVFDFLNTSQGLWVASDTDRIGNWQYKGRIALMPAAGKQMPAIKTPTLPNDIFAAGAIGQATDPSVLYRVNAGGDALGADSGIDWEADTDGSQSPYHNHVSNRAGYSSVPNVDASVPAGTPRDIFSTELWSPGTNPDQQWDFPVPAGTPLEVRLYFANRYGGTSQPGQRIFNVDLEGQRVLDNFDITATVGHDTAMMRQYSITSDGNVDIDLQHVVENPLINGIEIRRTDAGPAPAPESTIVRRSYNNGNIGDSVTVPSGGKNWNAVRGAFMINGSLYTAWSDGTFERRAFDGTTYGPATPVNTQDQLVPLADWQADMQQASGMFYDSGRIYFTRRGSSQLFYRYFTAESGVVGAKRLVASDSVAGIDFSQVRGMFGTGTKLYWATADGALHQMDWAAGAQSGSPVAGTAAQVSGPGIDNQMWDAHALFLYQDSNGSGAGVPPTAAFTSSCDSRTCTFDGSGSTAPNASITSYAWDFGDGTNGTGAKPSHTFPNDGAFSVTLTVTTDKGGADIETKNVSVQRVNQSPTAAFTYSCNGTVCDFDAAGSSDPDGQVATYAWDFGDGKTGTGVTPTHDFGTTGTRNVTLTVTDNEGGTNATSRQVNATNSELAFVGADSTNGNRTSHTVQVPAGTQAGDTLVVFLTTNSTTSTIGAAPAGWSLIETKDGSGIRARAWTKTATAGDVGGRFTVTTSGYSKSDLSIGAYRASSGSSAVVGSASVIDQTSTTQHTTPAVDVTASGSWVVSYWATKSSGTPTWTLPAGQTARASSTGTGSGNIRAVVADGGSPEAVGTRGGLTATTSESVSRVAMFSIVIGLG